MRIEAVRNATLLVEMAGTTLLVDPMLAPAGALPPVGDPDGPRNPLVELPVPARELVERADAVLITHLHRDHFDADAGLDARVLVPDDGQVVERLV